MIVATIGHALQWGAALAALAAAALSVGALLRIRFASVSRRWARRTFFAAALLLAATTATVETALIRRDTDLAFVAKVTGEDMSLYYRIAALWSAMEGSLLFWTLILALVVVMFLLLSPDAPAVSAAAAVCVIAGFTAVSLLVTPFAAADGAVRSRPSPLLQDHPAMGIHPPLLYLGFAAMIVPYALGMDALARGALELRTVRLIRRWTLAGWVLLGSGIGLGAWWAYAVLGWGGYWAWDPVENLSLVPWIAATVLLHAVGPRSRDLGWRRWAVVTAGLPFVLVLLATFLTRSGLLASVHTFSVSPVGAALAILAATGAAAWLTMTVRGANRLPAAPRRDHISDRLRLYGRVALLFVVAVVLAGTIAPGIVAWATGQQISLGSPWYARTLGPLAIAVLVLMAIAPLVARRRFTGEPLAGAIGAAPVAVLAVALGAAPALTFAIIVATFVVITSAIRAVRRGARAAQRGGMIAHAGVALTAVVVVASGGATVVERTLEVGESAAFAGIDAILVSIDRESRGPYTAGTARLLLSESGGEPFEAMPELRSYDEHGEVLAGPDIRAELTRDIYVSLLDLDAQAGQALVRVAVFPLLPWLWVTGAVILVGGAVSLVGRGPRRKSDQPALVAARGEA